MTGFPVQSKDELEREKLRAEIRHLNALFYRTPTFWLSVVPLLIAIGGLVFQGQAWTKAREKWESQEESRNLRLREAEVDTKQARIDLVSAREELQFANAQLQRVKDDTAAKLAMVSELESNIIALNSRIQIFQSDLLGAGNIVLRMMGREDVDPLAVTVDPTREEILWIATKDAIYKSEDTDLDGEADRLTRFADSTFRLTERGVLSVRKANGSTVVQFTSPSQQFEWRDSNDDDFADGPPKKG